MSTRGEGLPAAARTAYTVGKPAEHRGSSAVVETLLVGVVAVIGVLAFALANSAWAEWIHARLASDSELLNGLAFSAFPLVLGAAVVAWAPRQFGLTMGSALARWRLVLILSLAMAAFAAAALALVGSNPFRGANFVVEVIGVPVSEELVFRGVLFTLVLAALRRLHAPGRALWLAVVISGIAFGAGHLNNLSSYDAGFVVPQAIYASILGLTAGWLRASTASLLPPVFMHAFVNLVATLV